MLKHAVGTRQPRRHPTSLRFLAWYSAHAAVSMPADPVELDRLNQHSPTPVDYLFLDLNANWIQLDGRWAALAMLELTPGKPLGRPVILKDL